MIPNKDKHDVQYTECKKISTSCDCLIIYITSCSLANQVNGVVLPSPIFSSHSLDFCSSVQINQGNEGNVIHFLIQLHFLLLLGLY